MEHKQLEFEKKKFHLSNERTFLSYVRTSASVLVLSLALYRFFESTVAMVLATVCLVIGFLIIALGVYRFFSEKGRITEENI
jgi:uncharacterized membrane protein YidH (DUF202 family)